MTTILSSIPPMTIFATLLAHDADVLNDPVIFRRIVDLAASDETNYHTIARLVREYQPARESGYMHAVHQAIQGVLTHEGEIDE